MFVDKVRDIVGLYMDPPLMAMVLCVDEKGTSRNWACAALSKREVGQHSGMITPRIKPSGFFPEEAADDMELVRQRKAKLEGYVQTLAAMDELIDFSEMAGAETQPTLDIIRNMARALSVSADSLVFEQDERNPNEGLLLQFEAISQLLPEEQAIVKEVLDSLIIKYQARRWDSARNATASQHSAPAEKSAPSTKKRPTNKRSAPASAHR